MIEANEPGWGASGRNGGQLNPGLKYGPATVAATFTNALVQRSQGAVGTVFSLVGEEGIECEIRRGGTLRAATDTASLANLKQRSEEASAYGIDYRMLSAEATAEATGSGRYTGGLFDPAGCPLNPLKYSLGLASAVRRRGVAIHSDSPAMSAKEVNGVWHIETPEGKIAAKRVLFATNGYTDGLVPGLRRTVLPVFNAILASRPLPDDWIARILPDGQSCFEVGPALLRKSREGFIS